MFYAAKCYWPGITEVELRRVAARVTGEAGRSADRTKNVSYIGSMLFPDDALVLCLFDAPSRSAVRKATRRAGIPCERVMASVWFASELERSTSCAGLE
jgi:hypothetical protein